MKNSKKTLKELKEELMKSNRYLHCRDRKDTFTQQEANAIAKILNKKYKGE